MSCSRFTVLIRITELPQLNSTWHSSIHKTKLSMAETIRRIQEEKCGFDQLERIIRTDGQLR